MNLFRLQEIEIIAQAIAGMVFRCERTTIQHKQWLYCRFKEREILRICLTDRQVYLTAKSGTPQLVYTFRWWSWSDWTLWWKLKDAVSIFDEAVGKIQLHDYRAFFGHLMSEMIEQLADLMELAEKEQEEILRIDQSRGGTHLHPQIQSMLQTTTEDLSMYGDDIPVEDNQNDRLR